MKTFITILFVAVSQLSYSQDILGLYIDIDGSVKFWKGEANRNGHVEDTVRIKCGEDIFTYDLRNLKYDHLTLIEAEENPPRYGDPSNMNDTTQYQVINDWSIINYTLESPFFIVEESIDTSDLIKRPFSDETRGDGLSDSIVKMLETKLTNHVNQFYGKAYPQKDWGQIYKELSVEDTVIDKQGIYDYIVDELIFYNYEDENLTSKIWYHWDYGIEVDSLKYDKKGNLIYFSRESLGSYREELFFKYNSSTQVILIEQKTIGIESNNHNWEPVKFSYNDVGIMNSKSVFGSDDIWHTCYYDIKKRVTPKPKQH